MIFAKCADFKRASFAILLYKSELLHNFIIVILTCDNCLLVLLLLLLLNKKFLLHFRFLRNLPTILFLYKSIFLLLCYSCYSCDIYLGVLLLQWNFLSLICDFCRLFLDFCKQFLLNIIMFAKIATKICEESFATACNPYWICYFCFICSLFYTFLTVRFIFCAKIAKAICYQIFATVFNPGHKWRATTRQYATLSTILLKQKLIQ